MFISLSLCSSPCQEEIGTKAQSAHAPLSARAISLKLFGTAHANQDVCIQNRRFAFAPFIIIFIKN